METRADYQFSLEFPQGCSMCHGWGTCVWVLWKLNRDKENPMRDNWKHRNDAMRCSACMYFVPKLPVEDNKPEDRPYSYNLGRCRRHSPTLGGWPAVFITDWCGDHKLDENASHGLHPK
jgi:hypothetical protein